MPTRTNDLTESAKPIADKLVAQYGVVKKVLSAGILALDDLMPEEREYYMAKAAGVDLPISDDAFRRRVLRILEDSAKIPAKKKPVQRAKKSTSAE
jgi:hypothetical protein